MAVNSDHVAGFVVGLGTATLGLYLYKKNQAHVDQWLRQQGLNVPQPASGDPGAMSLEELMSEKERLEDLIAEREAAAAPSGSVSPDADGGDGAEETT
jgi:hypothetical protein